MIIISKREVKVYACHPVPSDVTYYLNSENSWVRELEQAHNFANATKNEILKAKITGKQLITKKFIHGFVIIHLADCIVK